jgi:Reverse transcriptase (RNA-dependent DNA polymerase)
MMLDRMANLGKWEEFSEVRYHQNEVEVPSEDGLVEDAWTDMAEAPDLKGREEARPWKERVAHVKAGWKGSQEDFRRLEKIMAMEKGIFDPPRPGTVKHYEAHLRKIPGMNITHASRRSLLGHKEERVAREKAEELQADDFTEFSDSPISSHVRMVPKPDGALRFCVNYYRANKIIEGERYPLPKIDDCMRKLKHARYYTVLDLKNGFWQIPLSKKSRWLTAFVVGMTLYQWKVLPMGLRNSPGIFQAAMQKMLGRQFEDGKAGGFVEKYGQKAEDYAFCYIDDIIIYSNTMEDHLAHIRDIFRRIREFGLKVNMAKCQFATRRVTYLGYDISEGTISIAAKKR